MNTTSTLSIFFIGLILFFSISQSAAQKLTKEGPAPFEGGQSEASNDNQVGAINAIAAHPTNSDIIYIGTVNGGVWKTTNATVESNSPTWTPLTDFEASLSIQSLELDPTDKTSQTLVAGIGRVSSYAQLGGSLIGLLRTVDGGQTWTPLTDLAGSNISGIAPRGSIIVASADEDDFGFNCASTGIFRSTDSGNTFTQVTAGISGGSVDALTSDPGDQTVLYASIVRAASDCGGVSGIYKSSNTGESWEKISDSTIDQLMQDTTSTHVEIAVGNHENVFVGVASNGQLSGVFYSSNGGESFIAMDIPGTREPDDFFGIHPGGQANIHMSMIADPTDDTVVYIGGDRQPAGNNDGTTGPQVFPNSLGAQTFSGRLFRGDASAKTGTQWSALTHSGTLNNTGTHADSRDMLFTADGNLLESNDGGIYIRTSPQDGQGDWTSLNGNLQNSEVHSAAYDSNSDILAGGTQDNGQGNQIVAGMPAWEVLIGGDGGDFDIDVETLAGKGQSIRYTSSQNLENFVQIIYDANNNLVDFSFRSLEVVGGDLNPIAQFVHPVAINSENPVRLVFGYSNSEIDGDDDGNDGGLYESFDQGNTLRQLTPTGIEAFAFGPNSITAGAPGNEEQLFVAGHANGNQTHIYRRLAANQDLESVFSSDNVLVSVSQHQTNANELAVLELFGGVFITDDTGDEWTDVTGNLSQINQGPLLTVVFLANPFESGDMLLVGSIRGLFIASEKSGYTQWSPLTTELPNAPIYGLNFNKEYNQLFINTLGRGTFSYQPLFEFDDLIFLNGFE